MKGATTLLITSTLVACGTGQRTTIPITAPPPAVPVSDAGGPTDGGAADAAGSPRPFAAELWLRDALERCRQPTREKDTLQRSMNICMGPKPSVVQKADVDTCIERCKLIATQPTHEELAVYEKALRDCIARVEQTLGYEIPECRFGGLIRRNTSLGNPWDSCNQACQMRALELQQQWRAPMR